MRFICERWILACFLGIVLAASVHSFGELPLLSRAAVPLLIASCVVARWMGSEYRVAVAAIGFTVCAVTSCRLLVNTGVTVFHDKSLCFRPAVFLLAMICLFALLQPSAKQAFRKPVAWTRTLLFTAVVIPLLTVAAYSVLSRRYTLESNLLTQVVMNSTSVLASFAITTAGFSDPYRRKRFEGLVILGLAGMLMASLLGGRLL